jgi:uncharacterized protein
VVLAAAPVVVVAQVEDGDSFLVMKSFLLIFILSAQFASAQVLYNKTAPPKAVNDFGNFLETFQRDALEKKLDAYNDSTSSAIVIITVPDLQDYDISDLALKYLRD